ncbi:MAG: stalk domain-containing protein [Moorellales bacterium]
MNLGFGVLRRVVAAVALITGVTLPFPALADVDQAPKKELVRLQLGSRLAWVREREVELAVAPRVVEGTTLVPLRFLAEALGVAVNWDPGSRTVTIAATPAIRLQVGNPVVRVGDREERLAAAPIVDGGTVLVPLRLVAQNLAGEVVYRPETKQILVYPREQLPVAVIMLDKIRLYLGEKLQYRSASFSPEGLSLVEERWENLPPWTAPGQYTITLQVKDEKGRWSLPAQAPVEVMPPPNRPPVARFQVSKSVVAQGEKVEYIDDSYDPDGDALEAREWRGKREVFFSPGTYTVSLRVKDSRGLWSEPYSINLTVTNRVLMDELTYNLRYTLPGETFTVPANRWPEMASLSVEQATGGTTLVLSNSPENIPGPGILYRDAVEGAVRLFYWHANGTAQPLQVVVLAENKAVSPARLRVLKEGLAGPDRDAFGVGRKAMLRYWDSAPSPEIVLEPGELYVLNFAQYRSARPGEIVHGIYELEVVGRMDLAVVALPPDTQLRSEYYRLAVLTPDNVHCRGTFANADYQVVAALPSGRPTAITFPVSAVQGLDALTGLMATNRGGYGLLYSLRLTTGEERAVLLNPRGGGVAGAVRVNGSIVPLPRTGVGAAPSEAVKVAHLSPGREAEIFFMPPGGANLPLRLLFWPLP